LSDQGTPASSPAPKFFYGYVIVICTFFIMMFLLGSITAFGVFFTPVSEAFNWNRATTSGAFSLNQILVGLAGIVMGGLNDRLGPRIVMTVCGIMVGAGFIMMSYINSLWQLYFFYGIVIGIGQGGGYVPTLSTVARWFTKNRSFMTGLVLIGFSLGELIAPPISNRLIENFDWQKSYLILGVIILVVVVIASQFLKRDPSLVGSKPYGDEKSSKQNIAVKGLSLKEAANTRQFWIFNVMEFIFGFILMTILVHLIPHIQDLGISPALAAIAITIAAGFSILGRLVLGRAGDKVGNRIIFAITFLLIALDLAWLIFIHDIIGLYIFAAIFGFAYGGTETSESPMVAWLFGIKSHGLIFGVQTLWFAIGAAVGPLAAGFIFDTYTSYQNAFVIMAVLGIIGVILSLALKPVINNKKAIASS
jgi:MFS family permease